LGFVVVAHPFHALTGQRLELLFVKRHGLATVFVCSGDVSGQITLPLEWTDRSEPANSLRPRMIRRIGPITPRERPRPLT
jgi:hypothetical protein